MLDIKSRHQQKKQRKRKNSIKCEDRKSEGNSWGGKEKEKKIDERKELEERKENKMRDKICESRERKTKVHNNIRKTT